MTDDDAWGAAFYLGMLIGFGWAAAIAWVF